MEGEILVSYTNLSHSDDNLSFKDLSMLRKLFVFLHLPLIVSIYQTPYRDFSNCYVFTMSDFIQQIFFN